MSNNNPAIIFDLDGTLIDSEGNYFLADREFVRSYGGEYTEEMNARFIGAGCLNFVKWVKDEYSVSDPIDVMLRKKNDIYLRYAREKTELFPEMERFLALLKENSVPMAIASGSSLEIIKEMVDITGTNDYFECLVSSEEVVHGKPAPDVFLETAARMKVAPRQCIVVEDSVHGVEAALRADMKCLAIPSVPLGGEDSSFFKAHILCTHGMKDFDPDFIFQNIQRGIV